MTPSDPLEVLACPVCAGRLARGKKGSLTCGSCGRDYLRNERGYLEFDLEAGGARESGERLDAYAAHQEESGGRLFHSYLKPWAASFHGRRILDAGCGAGRAVELFAEEGLDAYGVDLPKASVFWARREADPDRFVCGDVTALPFAAGVFDGVMSLGVIEHVGTVTGHATLAPDFADRRRRFARELVRVTRPGGRILVSCPNKSFPVDLHHGPADDASQPGPFRGAVHRATGLNVHRTWGDYHLVSFSDIVELFSGAGADAIRPAPASGYFAFESLPQGAVRSAVRAYVERLPDRLRGTPIDPFILAEIRV